MNKSRSLALANACALALLLMPVCAARADDGRGGGDDGRRSGGDDDGKDGHRLTGLAPGKFVVHKQKVPVRVVLVGFGANVQNQDILDLLPATYRPVVRYPRFYNINGRDLGLEYQFRYHIARKSDSFARRLFTYVKSVGTEGPLTPIQELYNEQDGTRDVTGPVLYVDAPKVEKWLANNDAGQDSERGYTIYFINWYGRPDFQFHVYTKTDQPDPDTGYNFGEIRASRKIVSWGGTHSRSWFYDFSAGPESWANNFEVTNPDLDGDGEEDYRIPPIWEYAVPGFRTPEDLGFDMGLLARFVAIDLLFTTSPLYDPLFTAPEPGGRKIAHVAMFEDEAGMNGSDWFRPLVVKRQWERFQPYYRWKVGFADEAIDADAKRSLDIFTGNLFESDCWNAFGTTFAQLFCYFDANLAHYVPSYNARDYVGEIFAFNSSEAGLGSVFGLLGFADDNWVDGTQTYEFVFGSSAYRDLGYGFSSTVIHEFGHHIGMSHPHDGYDSEFNIDYGPSNFFNFAWLGDESDTVMQYLSVSNGFGRHNQDNMYRWEASGYLNWANALAGDILASPQGPLARPAVQLADRLARKANEAFDEWEYVEAAENAREAYALLKVTADTLHVTSSAFAESKRLTALGMGPSKEGCRPRHMRE